MKTSGTPHHPVDGTGSANGRRRSRTARTLTAAVAGAAMLVVAGCSPDAEETTSPPGDGGAPADLAGTLAISNWQFLAPDRGEGIWSAMTGYGEENPDVEFEEIAVAFGSYADRIRTEIGGGAGPDIVVMNDNLFSELAQAGLLEPIDDLVSETDADLNTTNESGVWEGEQLALGWERANYALVWNEAILEEAGVEPPTTFPELLEAATTIEEETGIAGFAVRHQIAELDGWGQDFANWSYGFGGSWAQDGELTIDSPENIEAVTAFKEMYDSGAMPVGDDASTFRTKFRQGQLGMIIDNSGATFSLTAGVDGGLTGTDVGASALPFPEPGAHQQLLIGINANSDNKELAKDYLRWLLSQPAQEDLAEVLGAATLATEVPLDTEFGEANPWATEFKELAEESRSPLIPGFEAQTPEITEIILSQVERVLTQDLSPEEAMATAQAEAEAAVP